MKKAALLMSILLLLGFTFPFTTQAEETAILYMPLFFESEIPRDIELIKSEIRRITNEKTGTILEVVPLLSIFRGDVDPVRAAELDMLAKEGIYMDIFPSYLSKLTYLEPISLNTLLPQYGKGIVDLTESLYLPFIQSSEPIYEIDSVYNRTSAFGITMRKDIVEKYNIDLTTIHSIEDLDDLFSYLSPLEPDLKMIAPYQTRNTLLANQKHAMLVKSSIGDLSKEDPTQVINYYATDTYQQWVSLFRKWRLEGYMPDDMAIQNIHASQLVNAGELFSYFSAHRPGIDFEESQNCGQQMVSVPLAEPVLMQRSMYLIKWCISTTCTAPEKAMEIINLLYTDAALANVLMYGIEGIHYSLLNDGTIDYLQSTSVDTIGYKNALAWSLPNPTVAHVWHGNDLNLWEQLKAYNIAAMNSNTYGFSFDTNAVLTEYTQVNQVLSTYAYGLENGFLDPDIYLPQMIDEMKAAGSEILVQEMQKQLDAYLARKGVSP